ncbi:hypothetical protein [Pusillimonas sp. ANT_WB101]|uniref:hypothetical protein n=1 Tax=Pusillimonas sp. ANT_WB101 TaxID=2597356 RepID=UPI0011EC9AB7|nr:hypothetical protein [Pusillimonas sp. ANT_WB101]KAA0892549.1 hypothetical protein FQ179_09525 [Pusillimonas sp. ANT_WB101]
MATNAFVAHEMAFGEPQAGLWCACEPQNNRGESMIHKYECLGGRHMSIAEFIQNKILRPRLQKTGSLVVYDLDVHTHEQLSDHTAARQGAR